MTKRPKKTVRARTRPMGDTDIYLLSDKFMDKLREMDSKDPSRKVVSVMREIHKKAIKEPFRAALGKVRNVIPKGALLKPLPHEFADSAELNALMKESLKHRSFKGMTEKEISAFLQDFDKKLDLPDISSGSFLKVKDPKTKVYRDGADVYHEVEISDSIGKRQGGETQYLEPKKKFGKAEVKDMERAHSIGPGLGLDSPYGVFFAPRHVNQVIQNQGMEAFIGILQVCLKSEGKIVKVTTRATPHIGTHRLKEMAYKIDVIDKKTQQVEQLMQYGISVGNDAQRSVNSGATAVNKALSKRLGLQKKMSEAVVDNKAWKSGAQIFLATFFE